MADESKSQGSEVGGGGEVENAVQQKMDAAYRVVDIRGTHPDLNKTTWPRTGNPQALLDYLDEKDRQVVIVCTRWQSNRLEFLHKNCELIEWDGRREGDYGKGVGNGR